MVGRNHAVIGKPGEGFSRSSPGHRRQMPPVLGVAVDEDGDDEPLREEPFADETEELGRLSLEEKVRRPLCTASHPARLSRTKSVSL